MQTTAAGKRLSDALEAGRVCRHSFRAESVAGEQMTCALATMWPDAGLPGISNHHCPADLLPGFVAILVPWWCDRGSASRWIGAMRELADLIQRSTELFANPDRCRKLDFSFRAVALREVARKIGGRKWIFVSVIYRALALCDRVAGEEVLDTEEWCAVRAAVKSTESANEFDELDEYAAHAVLTVSAVMKSVESPEAARAAVEGAIWAVRRTCRNGTDIADRLTKAMFVAWWDAIGAPAPLY